MDLLKPGKSLANENQLISALGPVLVRDLLSLKVAYACPNLCDPMDYMVHGILQARILEWVAFPFSRGSSRPRDRTQVSRIAGRRFNLKASRIGQTWRLLIKNKKNSN